MKGLGGVCSVSTIWPFCPDFRPCSPDCWIWTGKVTLWQMVWIKVKVINGCMWPKYVSPKSRKSFYLAGMCLYHRKSGFAVN